MRWVTRVANPTGQARHPGIGSFGGQVGGEGIAVVSTPAIAAEAHCTAGLVRVGDHIRSITQPDGSTHPVDLVVREILRDLPAPSNRQEGWTATQLDGLSSGANGVVGLWGNYGPLAVGSRLETIDGGRP